MKKFFMLLVGFIVLSVNLSAMDVIRVSLTTTPFNSKDVYIDILNSDGSSSVGTRITKTALSTNGAGVITFTIDETQWTSLAFGDAKNYIVKITLHRGTGDDMVIGMQRLEDLISKQGLFGAKISPEDIDQTKTYTFNSLTVKSGDINLFELSENGSNKITLQAPDALADDLVLTLPSNSGGNGQVLQTDGAGTTSWANPAATTSYLKDTYYNSGIVNPNVVVKIMVLNDVPAGTYAVNFKIPFQNSIISSNGLILVWAVTINDAAPSFPDDGIASTYCPPSPSIFYNFGQSGYTEITLNATSTIELKMIYYGENTNNGSLSFKQKPILRVTKL